MELAQYEKKSKDLISNEDITLINRLYLYFFYSLRKKDLSIFLSVIFLILETIQLISFAFSEPVKIIYYF